MSMLGIAGVAGEGLREGIGEGVVEGVGVGDRAVGC